MAKSILTDDMDRCYICGRTSGIQIHHCIYGRGLRKLSDQDGLTIPLCVEHHLGAGGVHFNRELDQSVKELAQLTFEKAHSRKEFIQRYGRSYL